MEKHQTYISKFSYKELILKISSQIHYSYKPRYVLKGLAGIFLGKKPNTYVNYLVTLF